MSYMNKVLLGNMDQRRIDRKEDPTMVVITHRCYAADLDADPKVVTPTGLRVCEVGERVRMPRYAAEDVVLCGRGRYV